MFDAGGRGGGRGGGGGGGRRGGGGGGRGGEGGSRFGGGLGLSGLEEGGWDCDGASPMPWKPIGSRWRRSLFKA